MDLVYVQSRALMAIGKVKDRSLPENRRILEPGVALGAPKAIEPAFCDTGHGVPALPQTATEMERENCMVRTSLSLALLNALNAPQMNCSYALSVNRTRRVRRGSKDN